DNERAAASGKRREDADAMSGKLNKALTALSGIIGKALASWGVDGEMPDTVDIERAGGFTVVQKAKIAARHLAQDVWRPEAKGKQPVVKDSQGRLINVAPDIARRHVVSPDDIATHYGNVLAKKKLSAAKLLVEQSGSIPAAHEPVTEKRVTSKLVTAAA